MARVNVWVQIHNLPHEYFSVANGNLLGGLAGKAMTMDLDEEKPASWNVFLRVQVDLEFTKPLVSGYYFDLYSGVKRWLQFKYEKNRIFCYNCGCLGHQRRGYSLSSPVTVASCDGVPFPLYGPWLSTMSSYQDVFSGAQPIPRLGSTVASLEASKALPPPTISNPVDGKPMPLVPKTGRGPRRAWMVSDHGSAGQRAAQRAGWKPRKGSVCRELAISPMGNGADVGMSRKEMPPATFPILEDILVDCAGEKIDLLNDKGIVGQEMENSKVNGPGVLGQEDVATNGMDLFEIKSLGGDIGFKTTFETNVQTTPFKKRKLYGDFYSLCSRPHKIIQKHPGVVRDFPWDTNEKEEDQATKVAFEEPSEDLLDSLSHT
ncbi:hypothetical protein F8388_019559 [Cannabis sativa]|uniref:Zinc knuckle CX2CX4HX4C domain-containing protein n=1 Tax=Cannabis sativa TaxID=3483 RepID=A0A7J6FF63_CANSA|nr:hypothetical protein F8388_019559 [Cannabis sativa]